jgi:hypothetical protein
MPRPETVVTVVAMGPGRVVVERDVRVMVWHGIFAKSRFPAGLDPGW